MKITCKCGNIEELETDKPSKNFDGTIALVCKQCSDVVFTNLKNS